MGSQTGGIFAATGNALPDGQPSETIDYAEDVVKISFDLGSLLSDDNPLFDPLIKDADFGATPMLFTAKGCLPSLAAVAKSGELFVYWDRNNLANPQRIAVTKANGHLVGIPAWDNVTQRLLVTNPADSAGGPYKRGLLAFKVQGCQLVLDWQTATTTNPPTIVNPTYLSPPTAANGVVYFGVGGGFHASVPPAVYAISQQAGKAGHVLWKSTDITGPVLTAPMVVNGQMYVGTFDNKVIAYGLPG